MSNLPHVSAFETACERGEIPGAVLVAADATGKFRYARAFGQTAHGEKLEVDSTMWIASSTKLMMAVAALQQVERGLLGLDDELDALFPEATAQGVLVGWDGDGDPIIEKREGVITLRRMLSHSSGHGHPKFDPKLQPYVAWKGGQDPHMPLVKELSVPLLFQPGRGWTYGSGPDWAGKLVERLSGLSLEEYMRANIWEPLGMKHVSFRPSHPDIQSHKVGLSVLDDEGRLIPTKEGYLFQWGEVDDAYGGSSCWCSPESFLALLQSLCANDGKVIGKELGKELFRPQLGPESKEELNRITKSGETIFSRVFEGSWTASKQDFDHALGGLIGLKNEPGRRKAGTMTWTGGPNIWWFIDRTTGLCGAYFCQLLPIGNLKTIELEKLFEADIYNVYEEFLRNN